MFPMCIPQRMHRLTHSRSVAVCNTHVLPCLARFSNSCSRMHSDQRSMTDRMTSKINSSKGQVGDTCNSTETTTLYSAYARRQALVALGAVLFAPTCVAAAVDLVPALITIEAAPDQSTYDPADPQLREAAGLLQQGLNATDVTTEEAIWTEIIDKYSGLDAPWVPDVVGRAWGNRGNARSRQGRMQEALSDYNQSMRICPWSVDPVLNRGVVLEALGRFEEAVEDYRAVLAVAPNDPAAWNNLGNANAGLGRWDEALEYYGKAASLAPSFSFASANRALAMYQLGRDDEAIREFRTLLRRYPDFPDMRAALAAALWAAGKEGDAESNWERVEDARYRNRTWLKAERRWPPRLVAALSALLELRSLA